MGVVWFADRAAPVGVFIFLFAKHFTNNIIQQIKLLVNLLFNFHIVFQESVYFLHGFFFILSGICGISQFVLYVAQNKQRLIDQTKM